MNKEQAMEIIRQKAEEMIEKGFGVCCLINHLPESIMYEVGQRISNFQELWVGSHPVDEEYAVKHYFLYVPGYEDSTYEQYYMVRDAVNLRIPKPPYFDAYQALRRQFANELIAYLEATYE